MSNRVKGLRIDARGLKQEMGDLEQKQSGEMDTNYSKR